MKPTLLHALAVLSKKRIPSSQALASELSISQQTASRWIRELLRDGLIEKKAGAYPIAPRGSAYLSSLLPPERIEFSGNVFTGLGEGKYYLGKSGYKRQFPSVLGFQPYPGTLNLRVAAGPHQQALLALRSQPGLILSGFSEKDRTFGGARCYPVQIGGKLNGALIVPDRTHYPDDVAEILSPVFLRKALGLTDGQSVTVRARSQSTQK